MKTTRFGTSSMVVLKSRNAVQVRVYYMGVLANWFFFTLGHFLAWNQKRKTRYLQIFDEHGVKHMFFKKIYCNRVLILAQKHVFLTKYRHFCSSKLQQYSVISFLSMVSKKVSFFHFLIENHNFEKQNMSFKNLIFHCIFDFDKFFWNHLSHLTSFFETTWGFNKFFFRKISKFCTKLVVSWPKFGPKMTKKEVSRKLVKTRRWFQKKCHFSKCQ